MPNSKDFTTALENISKHHSTELAINTPSNNSAGYIGQSESGLHPEKCVPAVINSLIREGFISGMGPKGLEVDKV